jgi:flagellar basal-body rod protein FlgG
VGTDDFGVNTQGFVSVNGTVTARIAVVDFQDLNALRKAGDNLYTVYGNANPYPAENYSVMQGYLEGSNLDIAKEMSNMIITERAYEANQRILRMIDDTLNKTVNEIARF